MYTHNLCTARTPSMAATYTPPQIGMDGHQLVKMSLGLTTELVDGAPADGWHDIFNDEPQHGPVEEATGRQSTDELPQSCCNEVASALWAAGMLGDGCGVTHVVGLRSLAGPWPRQVVHAGMDPTGPIFRLRWDRVPRGALFFPDGGKFHVHPKGRSCLAPGIDVDAPPGHAVIFRSDLRHCGAAYPLGNRRIFAHVGVPGHSRVAQLPNGEQTTGVSCPCCAREHQKGCPGRVSASLNAHSMEVSSPLTIRRLNGKGHLPLPTVQGSRKTCQLHAYVLRADPDLRLSQVNSKHVMLCASCNVNLCGLCFYSFHTDVNPIPAERAARP